MNETLRLKAARLSQKEKLPDSLVFLIFFIIGVIFFGNTLHKSFLCDDFSVLYRVIYERNFFLKGFFRPLSDISLFVCYLIGGLNPFVYNLFNFLFHICCTFVLYRFCLQSHLFKEDKKYIIAWCSALFFLVYPYHNESIVWVVGRASIMASFLSFLSLLIVFSNLKTEWKYLWAGLCYFIGLASYETILPLPAIVLVMLYQPKRPIKDYMPWLIIFSSAFLLNMLVRFVMADGIAGGYGQRLFLSSIYGYFLNFFKVIGRSFMPPSDNQLLLSIGFALVMAIFSFGFLVLLKNKADKISFAKLTVSLLLSYLIPVMFGVSTRTFEGDRVLYFSSYFLVIWIAFFISLMKGSLLKVILFGFVFLYFSFFLIKNNNAWLRSSKIAVYLIDKMRAEKREGRSIGLINIPQEVDGALTFRNGFKEALLLNNIDTSNVFLLRTLTTEEAREANGSFTLKKSKDAIFVPPSTFLYDSVIKVVQPVSKELSLFENGRFNSLYYWNKKELVKLDYKKGN